MRILLIGATGQLGGDLVRCNPGHEIIAPTRAELDLERLEGLPRLLAHLRPALLINCAAFHNVPLCETEGEKAFRINCIAVRELARHCSAAGIRFVTFSTDYVFRGDKRAPYVEDDPVGPVQMYGITRAAGEHAALAEGGADTIVIRTCGLYGRTGAASKGGNFVDKRLREAPSNPTLEMGCDQTVSPTSTADLSAAVYALIDRPDAHGIYHLVNEGECTWYEFTCAIFQLVSMPIRVVPVDRGGRSGTMRRPLYSVLANTRARALGVVMPHWRDALARYLAPAGAERGLSGTPPTARGQEHSVE
jgi:dTDP-4-dehydrorhamnose reductase